MQSLKKNNIPVVIDVCRYNWHSRLYSQSENGLQGEYETFLGQLDQNSTNKYFLITQYNVYF